MNVTRLLDLIGDLKSCNWIARFQRIVAVVGVAATCASGEAATITLSAVQDTTIFDRPSSGSQRDLNFDGSGLQIWNNGGSNSTSGRRRDIVFQFNLSSLPASSIITSARLRYYDTGAGDYNGNNNIAFTNNTSLVTYDSSTATAAQLEAIGVGGNVAFSGTGMDEQYVTYTSTGTGATGLDRSTTGWVGQWWSFKSPSYKAANPQLDASSMNLSLDAGNAGGQYYNAGYANTSTLDRLNYAKSNNGFALFISDYVSTGGRSFGDVESGNPILLELELIPEPTSAMCALIGGLCVVASLRCRRTTFLTSTVN